ncbi:META domain-containing protein [Tabrizicola sp.]|uniref:META domain-containing protein n=1 Tax=Tabrizicola sp. TaxID=2005166 RepID=UPI003F30AC27
MRRLLVLALAMMPAMSTAQTITGKDWELLAIDGVFFDAQATMRIEPDGSITGKAPCNSWGTGNAAELPELAIKGIRATRRACDKLAEEQAFFDALALMTSAKMDGSRNLILTGPDGRTMEFVTEVMNSMTVCKTCPPKD